MTQTSNNTVNAIINNFNKASKKAQKNGNYIKTVKVTDDIRLVYDLGWFDNHYLGNIRIQQKQVNGRYATIGKWVWRNGDFENFVEETFDVMLDTDGKVLTEEERKVAEKAKAIAANMGFDFYGRDGEYLVSAENDCIYTVNVEFRHNEGIEISEFYDGLICTNLAEPFDCFDESDFEADLKEAIGNVAASALSDMVSYLNDDCYECIEDTFDTNSEEIGIDFKGREKSDAILVSFDKEMKSIIIRDCSGDTMVTDFSNFVEEFTDFCREKLGEEYTENWAYAAA